VTPRRSVDWSVLLGSHAPVPVLMRNSAGSELGALFSAFDTRLLGDQTDALLRRACEVARSHIGLDRVGVFLLDESAQRLLGTWGTNLRGELVDEHHVMFDWSASVLDVFRRAEVEGQPFTVLDNCPIVVQEKKASQVVGRGWLACTPIRSAQNRIGMMFNDVGLNAAPVDDAKQTRAAILCSLLGSLVELACTPAIRAHAPRGAGKHPHVRKVVALVARDPALAGRQLAASLDISPSHLARLFKAELGMSLVEYRNRLRLERFRELVDAGEDNLSNAARAAGFGSYAQFHRVFRSIYGAAPRAYLQRADGA
jgi:AraC-like DNA-binding protein